MAQKHYKGLFKKALLQFVTEPDPFLAMLKWVMTEMMRIEAEAKVGAAKGKHARERTTYFSGSRARSSPDLRDASRRIKASYIGTEERRGNFRRADGVGAGPFDLRDGRRCRRRYSGKAEGLIASFLDMGKDLS